MKNTSNRTNVFLIVLSSVLFAVAAVFVLAFIGADAETWDCKNAVSYVEDIHKEYMACIDEAIEIGWNSKWMDKAINCWLDHYQVLYKIYYK